MIISKTPVRISFFGGGTDYPDYFRKHSGAVLGTTINKYVYLSVNKLSPFFDYKIKLSYSLSEKVSALSEIQHPSVRECLNFKKWNEGLDVHVFADLPARTGLGSSSAFTVGLLNCLDRLMLKKTNSHTLAHDALFVEQKLIKERVGSQDQIHAAFGGFNIIEFKDESFEVVPVNIKNKNRQLLDENLMLFYTGINRYADLILKEQINNTRDGSKDLLLNSMHDMVYEAKEILESQDGLEMVYQIGNLLDKSWLLKKQLSSKISNENIDKLYDKAKAQEP